MGLPQSRIGYDGRRIWITFTEGYWVNEQVTRTRHCGCLEIDELEAGPSIENDIALER